MNSDILKGKWKQVQGGLKEKWGELTEDDLAEVNGNYEQLVGKIQERYGYQKEEAKKAVDSLINQY